MSKTQLIWNEYSSALKGYLISRLKDKHVSDDLLQEVFVKIHLKADSLKKEQSIKSWVFTITHNVLMDYFKKTKTISVDDLKVVSEEADKHDMSDCLVPLIKNLPEKYSKPLLLSEIEGLKQQVVADKLGLSLTATKSRIQRGREMLKQGFVSCCDYKINDDGILVGENQSKDDCKVCG